MKVNAGCIFESGLALTCYYPSARDALGNRYWPGVVALWTEGSEVRTKTTEANIPQCGSNKLA